MVAKPSQWFRVALFLVVGLAPIACGPRGTSGAIHDGGENGRAVEQLQGKWVLISFEPEVGFEPMLQGLMEEQRDTLLVTFNGRTITAEGPGISLTRNYEVVKSVFDHVDIVVFGEDGTNYEMIGRFVGDDLEFESRTAPWKGRGRLRRPESGLLSQGSEVPRSTPPTPLAFPPARGRAGPAGDGAPVSGVDRGARG